MSAAALAAPRAGAVRWSLLLGVACLLAAFYYAGSTAATIWHYGWTELFQDQFRQYTKLLDGSFVERLAMTDNSHRQITSNLIRLGDLHFGQADQTFGVGAGLLMMIVVLAGLAWRILGDRAQPWLWRAAATLAAALALGWLGSARLQVHGNESFQTYLVIGCAVLVVLCVEALRLKPRPALAALALTAAMTAVISFATGVAVAGLLLVLLVLRRVAWRTSIVLAVGVLFAVFAYMFLLPGADGVRNTLLLAPIEVVRNGLIFLSGSWCTAWLSYAGEGIAGFTPERMEQLRFGGLLVGSARALFALAGEPSLLAFGAGVGALGVAVFAWLLWRAWRQPDAVGRSEALGLGIAIFAFGIATLVALGRSRLFAEVPMQVIADRYVLWSALFWFGLALAATARSAQQRFVAPSFALAMLVVAAMLYPSNRATYGWIVAVEHEIERRAAQIQVGVETEGQLSFMDMPDLESARTAITRLRQGRYGMFRAERNHLLGASVPRAAADVPQLADLGGTAPVVELTPQALPAWHVEGRLIDPALRERVDGLVVVDRDGRVVGLGEFSFRSGGGSLARIDAMADGFDVYLRAEAPCEGLHLYGVDDAARDFVALAPLHHCVAAAR
jgi:hypothetical protein